MPFTNNSIFTLFLELQYSRHLWIRLKHNFIYNIISIFSTMLTKYMKLSICCGLMSSSREIQQTKSFPEDFGLLFKFLLCCCSSAFILIFNKYLKRKWQALQHIWIYSIDSVLWKLTQEIRELNHATSLHLIPLLRIPIFER